MDELVRAESRLNKGTLVMNAVARQLISFAVRAPSGHNTQPWQFSVEQDTIRIYPDLSRRLPVVDPDNHALFISLGCALENLVVAASQHGLAASVDYFPSDEPQECLRVRLSAGADAGEDTGVLFRAIPERQSNRGTYDGRAIVASDLARILAASRRDALEVRAFNVGDPDVEPMIRFVREGNIAQFNDPAFIAELVSWIRFSRGVEEGRAQEHHQIEQPGRHPSLEGSPPLYPNGCPPSSWAM
ncbi:hypothetical protein [Ectothiorhodospira sp. BSL-9]|uniref:hypothetical protein n=1 Tax=Ectothiorhodospira sp. BSL-9 TaxID=1442136 RepID=UPI000AC81B54|nr:hypothetical protein [Ectothiorhodospira sp. BSL-9]